MRLCVCVLLGMWYSSLRGRGTHRWLLLAIDGLVGIYLATEEIPIARVVLVKYLPWVKASSFILTLVRLLDGHYYLSRPTVYLSSFSTHPTFFFIYFPDDSITSPHIGDSSLKSNESWERRHCKASRDR